MKINIENCIRHSGAESHYLYVLQEFVKHIKQLKTSIELGDKDFQKKFFDCYVFDDNQPLPISKDGE